MEIYRNTYRRNPRAWQGFSSVLFQSSVHFQPSSHLAPEEWWWIITSFKNSTYIYYIHAPLFWRKSKLFHISLNFLLILLLVSQLTMSRISDKSNKIFIPNTHVPTLQGLFLHRDVLEIGRKLWWIRRGVCKYKIYIMLFRPWIFDGSDTTSSNVRSILCYFVYGYLMDPTRRLQM